MEVELPDGTIAEFPDDMHPDDIAKVLQQQFGGPQHHVPQHLSYEEGVAKLDAETDKSHTGVILPISRDKQGNSHFDADAGILGSIRRAVALPGQVYRGEVQMQDASGNISPEVIERATEFATTVSPAAPGMRSGEMIVPGIAKAIEKAPVALPEAAAIKETAKAGYEAGRQAAVDFHPEAVKSLALAVKQSLDENGVLAVLAPKTHRILSALSNPPKGAVAARLSSVEAARRSFGNAAKDFSNPTEQMAGKVAREALDRFMREPPEGAVLSGDAKAAAKVIREADKNYAAAKKSEALGSLLSKAENRTAAANSGLNLGNTLRARVADALNNPKIASRFTPDEIAALEQINRGSRTANATRYLGNALAAGGGIGASALGGLTGVAANQFGSGALTAGIIGAAVPATGYAMRKTSEKLTLKALENADKVIRANSPLAKSILASSPSVVARKVGSEALLRGLLAEYTSSSPSKTP